MYALIHACNPPIDAVLQVLYVHSRGRLTVGPCLDPWAHSVSLRCLVAVRVVKALYDRYRAFAGASVVLLPCSARGVARSLLSNNTFDGNTFLAATTSAPLLDSVSKYINALSFVLSASMQTRAAWANTSACMAAVTEGAIEATPKAYNIKPSVFAATFATSFLANTFASNVAFPHIVSAHSATVVAVMQLRNNVADSSVLRIIDASARLFNTSLVRNTVRGGSVFQGDSFQGLFEQVRAGFLGLTVGHLA